MIDSEDKSTIENEIGGVLRAVEFVIRTGSTDPSTRDSKTDNQNKADYRNQINKVANAIKDSIISLRNTVYGSEKSANSIPASKPQNKKGKVQVAVVALIVVLAFLAYYVSQRKEEESSLPPGRSIAVLPFEDMSPGKDQEYLGDGLAEEIINVLTRIEDLHVIGRTSSFSFKGKNMDLVAIGEQLGVETILEGSVRKSGNQIRVTVKLNNAKDGRQQWSETYDRELKDIFAIQDGISARIANRFKSTMKVADLWLLPRNTDAYELYLRARHRPV
jgi:TolB-like protein